MMFLQGERGRREAARFARPNDSGATTAWQHGDAQLSKITTATLSSAVCVRLRW